MAPLTSILTLGAISYVLCNHAGSVILHRGTQVVASSAFECEAVALVKALKDVEDGPFSVVEVESD